MCCVLINTVDIYIFVVCVLSIRFSAARSKEGVVDFTRGPELKVTKGKHGHLLVVRRGEEGETVVVRGILVVVVRGRRGGGEGGDWWWLRGILVVVVRGRRGGRLVYIY